MILPSLWYIYGLAVFRLWVLSFLTRGLTVVPTGCFFIAGCGASVSPSLLL